MVEEQAAEIDYRLKVRARQVGGLLGALGGATAAALGKPAHVGDE
jgi:hypothetical protein